MNLSFEQIKSVTVGAIRIWDEKDGIHFSKCTQKQVDAWNAFESVLGERAQTTSGVRLDFTTNSSSFSFTAASGKKFEIYINNILMYNITAGNLKDGAFSIAIDKTKNEENRVTLILPSHEIGVLSAVELDDGASLIPCKYDTKLLFIGDSITHGWDSGYDSLSYAYRTSRFFNADSVIYGVGGGFFHETILDDEFDYEPDAIIVAFGTNDWGRYCYEDLKQNIEKFLTKLTKRYPGKTIFGISPIWRADFNQTRAAGSFEDVCELVKSTYSKFGARVIDGITMVPHLPEFFADAYLHPNALGFGVYTENLIKIIKDYL